MIVVCPNCGSSVEVKSLGRKRLNIPLENILESLKRNRSMNLASKELHCSEGYIFSVLRANGLKLKDLISR